MTTVGVEFATTEAFCSIGTTTNGIEVTTGEIHPNPVGIATTGIDVSYVLRLFR